MQRCAHHSCSLPDVDPSVSTWAQHSAGYPTCCPAGCENNEGRHIRKRIKCSSETPMVYRVESLVLCELEEEAPLDLLHRFLDPPPLPRSVPCTGSLIFRKKKDQNFQIPIGAHARPAPLLMISHRSPPLPRGS